MWDIVKLRDSGGKSGSHLQSLNDFLAGQHNLAAILNTPSLANFRSVQVVSGTFSRAGQNLYCIYSLCM